MVNKSKRRLRVSSRREIIVNILDKMPLAESGVSVPLRKGGRFIMNQKIRNKSVNPYHPELPSLSARLHKIGKAKRLWLKYNNNINSYVENDQQETAAAISVASKPQSEIEIKYQDIQVDVISKCMWFKS